MRHAFTLMELLVAVAILAILAAVLLPVVAGSKVSAKRTVALSDVRQLGMADMLYRSEHDGYLTPLPVHSLRAEREPITGWRYGTTVQSLKAGKPNESDLSSLAAVPVYASALRVDMRLLPLTVATVAYDDFGRFYHGFGVVAYADGHAHSHKALECPGIDLIETVPPSGGGR